jgi:hypothetical protein
MPNRLRLRGFPDSLNVVTSVVVSLLHSLRFVVRSRAKLHLEIMALRQQLAVVNRSRRPRLRLTAPDRMLRAPAEISYYTRPSERPPNLAFAETDHGIMPMLYETGQLGALFSAYL